MNGDTFIHRAGLSAILLVAGIAATVSFVHIQHLALQHGQTEIAALLLPLSIDGTVVAASMTLLKGAKSAGHSYWLAQFMLVLAVIATLMANVGYGLPYGWAGALISGWPAVAFIGCAEMAIGMVRKTRKVQVARTPAAAAPTTRAITNGHTELPDYIKTATVLYGPQLHQGKVPTVATIRDDFKCGQPRAMKIRDHMRTLVPKAEEVAKAEVVNAQ